MKEYLDSLDKFYDTVKVKVNITPIKKTVNKKPTKSEIGAIIYWLIVIGLVTWLTIHTFIEIAYGQSYPSQTESDNFIQNMNETQNMLKRMHTINQICRADIESMDLKVLDECMRYMESFNMYMKLFQQDTVEEMLTIMGPRLGFGQ